MTAAALANDSPDRLILASIAAEIFGDGVWGEGAWRPRHLTSVDVMRFVVHLERRFGVSIPDQELRPDNFQSAASVLSLLDRHRAA